MDVSAGYVGVTGYWPPIIGVLMALSVYTAPILWHFGMVVTLLQLYKDHYRYVFTLLSNLVYLVENLQLYMYIFYPQIYACILRTPC